MLVGGNRPVVDGHVPPPPEPIEQEVAQEAHDWHSKKAQRDQFNEEFAMVAGRKEMGGTYVAVDFYVKWLPEFHKIWPQFTPHHLPFSEASIA
ncbi:hypothetical protein O3M35_005175 [Rhynocoris fuscipes]|uniref:Uncharacterized protein n=1 Tax=Rhynocoris fuscipes TaxID=488301 RepID=A0AAW1DPU4_9HEMI